jgi:hypothetical protein
VQRAVVPSIGSTTQQHSTPPPLSSPSKPSRPAGSGSTPRPLDPAMLTKSCDPFISRVKAALRAKYPAARSPPRGSLRWR